MITDEIRERLTSLKDNKYRDFQSGLIPGVSEDEFIGVRTPALRSLAKELSKRKDTEEFLALLPHKYFDENQLHAFIISLDKDYDSCIGKVNAFLPYVNNWATCDQMSPKIFKKHKDRLLNEIKGWLSSDATYTVRFAVKMLMEHYLDEDYADDYPKLVADISSDEYYINMMRAWYFATALAKQYDHILPYIEEHRLDTWTHNKAIQKSVESFRIAPREKEYLKTLRIKK